MPLLKQLKVVLGLNGQSPSQYALAEQLLRGDAQDPAELEHDVRDFLASNSWEVRNVAVKLIADKQLEPLYPVLAEKLLDRREAGIVRRNCAEMIGAVGLSDQAALDALIATLDDRYWEIRAESARTLGRTAPPGDEMESSLCGVLFGRWRESATADPEHARRHFSERNFEVRAALAQALGALGVSELALGALRGLGADRYWVVRCQAAVALLELAARLPEFLDQVRESLHEIDYVSDGATAHFVIRDVLSRICEHAEHSARPLDAVDVRRSYLDLKRGWNR